MDPDAVCCNLKRETDSSAVFEEESAEHACENCVVLEAERKSLALKIEEAERNLNLVPTKPVTHGQRLLSQLLEDDIREEEDWNRRELESFKEKRSKSINEELENRTMAAEQIVASAEVALLEATTKFLVMKIQIESEVWRLRKETQQRLLPIERAFCAEQRNSTRMTREVSLLSDIDVDLYDMLPALQSVCETMAERRTPSAISRVTSMQEEREQIELIDSLREYNMELENRISDEKARSKKLQDKLYSIGAALRSNIETNYGSSACDNIQ